MKSFRFPSTSPINDLYVEFETSTKYFHYIHEKGQEWIIPQAKEDQPRPYAPSMFIYAFFTFNTLYNIDWVKFKENNYQEVCFCEPPNKKTEAKNDASSNDFELQRSHKILDFICSTLKPEILTKEFIDTFTEVIEDYRRAQYKTSELSEMNEWIEEALSNFKYDSGNNNPREFKFYDNTVKVFINKLFDVLEGRDCLDAFKLLKFSDLIYHVRCNLFHGAKTPILFEENHQEERLVIYSAILTSINHLLFLAIDSTLCRKK